MAYFCPSLRLFICIVLMVVGVGISVRANAQPITLPGSADPSRVLNDDRAGVAPDRTLEPTVPSQTVVPLVPEGAQNLKFTLGGIVFEGMTAYDPNVFKSLYAPYLGREISVATLFEIMAKAQQRYLDDGYALTKIVIPNQNIESGQVRFSVIEGYVGDVEISAGIRPSYVIDDAISQITAMRPLNVKKLERLMLILNDMPDLNLSAVLAHEDDPARMMTGAIKVVLQKNQELSPIATVSINNHGSKFSGPWQAQASTSLYHVGKNYTDLSVSSMIAIPINEQKSISASYSVPVFGASGTRVSLASSRTLTQPGSSLSLLDIRGVSQNYETTISYPLIRQRDMTVQVDGGFEVKNSRTKILDEELYDDRLRILNLGANMNFTDQWSGYNVITFKYSQGLNILGVRESGSVDLSREDGKSDFQKAKMVIGRIQALPSNFEAYGVITGQYAFSPLLSSEEFGFGGGQIGRGYDSSEITGDHGISASLELRYNTALRSQNYTLSLQPYVFYDFGKVWNIDNGADNKVSAASAGFGIRANLNNDWRADLNFASPLTRSADNEPKYQNDVGARVLFSLTKSF